MKGRPSAFVILSALLMLFAVPLSAEGILVLGDSWAWPIVDPLREVLAENGHPDIDVVYLDDPVWARDFLRSAVLASIGDWLIDHPETNIVQLTIGSNDWEWGNNGRAGTYWVPSWAGTQKEVDMCQSIAGWIQTAADYILSIRPGIQVVWTGYDFFRPLDSGTPAQRNATLIMLADMAKDIAGSTPRLSYVDTNGLMQSSYGFDGIQHTQYDPAAPIPPGDPSLPDANLPSPIQAFRPDDLYHLTSEGFKVLAREQYSQVYRLLLDGEDFQINASLNDAWFDPATAGQGFLITVFPDVGQMFLAWFTYDVERPGEGVTAQLGEPGHRWLTAQGPYADNQAVLDVWVSSGGVFDSAEPAVTQEKDGEIIIEFSGCNAGTVSYDIASVDRQGVIPIERVALDNVALCESLNDQSQAK